jgi:hypothetical protein
MSAAMNVSDTCDGMDEKGFALLRGVFPSAEVDAMVAGLADALSREAGSEGPLRAQTGGVYASRNVLDLWPPAAWIWRRPALLEPLDALLGPHFGLVRVLYFDKPPGQTWSLPWHKDLTVAVRDNRLGGSRFRNPTRKAGVSHVEAPEEVLEQMATVRIHLDEVTEENGPLKVLPGSHDTGKRPAGEAGLAHTVFAGRGDVLLMRPLLAHCSGPSRADTTLHRRILHLEFAGTPELPDGYAWHQFVSGSRLARPA